MKEELVGLSSLKILYTHIHRQKEEEKKKQSKQKPQHPGFPRGPPPWY